MNPSPLSAPRAAVAALILPLATLARELEELECEALVNFDPASDDHLNDLLNLHISCRTLLSQASLKAHANPISLYQALNRLSENQQVPMGMIDQRRRDLAQQKQVAAAEALAQQAREQAVIDADLAEAAEAERMVSLLAKRGYVVSR
jgi:hypothetical protein